ncbi:MAG: lamin tail domain-containing protein [Thermoplasmata archaeon]
MKKAWAVLVVLVIASAIGLYALATQIGDTDPSPNDGSGESITYSVIRVLDGDTIEIEDYRVRLIGIDAPESGEPFYYECKSKLSELIGNNDVRLEEDIEDTDHYGRLLRYVWVDSLHVNMEMVRTGWAEAYPYPPNTKYASQFESAEQEARNAQRGMWEESYADVYISYVHENAAGNDWYNLNDEYIVFTNGGNTAIALTGWTVSDEVNHVYTFPSFTLSADASVTLYTGSGTDTATELYWGSGSPIWNNDGDTVYLRDSTGDLVDSYQW